MTYGPTQANLVLARSDFHPACANLHPARADLRPARADLCPACANLHPAHAGNQLKITLGALFYSYFHVLRWVQ